MTATIAKKSKTTKPNKGNQAYWTKVAALHETYASDLADYISKLIEGESERSHVQKAVLLLTLLEGNAKNHQFPRNLSLLGAVEAQLIAWLY